MSGVGSNGIVPIGPGGLLGDHKLEEPPRAVPSDLGNDPFITRCRKRAVHGSVCEPLKRCDCCQFPVVLNGLQIE